MMWRFKRRLKKLIRKTRRVDIPDSLNHRIEALFRDHLQEKPRFRYRTPIWAGSAACIAILCVGIFISRNPGPEQLTSHGNFTPGTEHGVQGTAQPVQRQITMSEFFGSEREQVTLIYPG